MSETVSFVVTAVLALGALVAVWVFCTLADRADMPPPKVWTSGTARMRGPLRPPPYTVDRLPDAYPSYPFPPKLPPPKGPAPWELPDERDEAQE